LKMYFQIDREKLKFPYLTSSFATSEIETFLQIWSGANLLLVSGGVSRHI